jgi:hypothetical protein
MRVPTCFHSFYSPLTSLPAVYRRFPSRRLCTMFEPAVQLAGHGARWYNVVGKGLRYETPDTSSGSDFHVICLVIPAGIGRV